VEARRTGDASIEASTGCSPVGAFARAAIVGELPAVVSEQLVDGCGKGLITSSRKVAAQAADLFAGWPCGPSGWRGLWQQRGICGSFIGHLRQILDVHMQKSQGHTRGKMCKRTRWWEPALNA